MYVKAMDKIGITKLEAGSKTYRQVLIGPDAGPNFAMRRFIIEPGGSMPLHTNSVEHEQLVLNGRARVQIGEETFEVKKDDVVFIPAGIEHSYRTLGDDNFVFICVVPNKEDTIQLVKK
jgi:quercetin dioxygenase-like cupin family protein